MPHILVTNDDGYRSEGILALADALRPLGDVTIVAPSDEASAIGHALTLRRPLRLEPRGRPRVRRRRHADRLREHRHRRRCSTRLPDLVVSGINKGWNLGDDVTYSGTVAGALEGALLGVPAIAVSLAVHARRRATSRSRPRAAASLARSGARARRCRRGRFSTSTCRSGPKGIRVTVQAQAQPHHVGRPSGTIRRGSRTTGSRKGRTSGSRTIGRTIRRCATATCR